VYEMTTIARTTEIAIEIGQTRWALPADAPTRTTSAASVAYATEDNGSAEKIGSARNFERSVSPNSAVARGRPITARFTASIGGWRGFWSVAAITRS
jgi:hypothetical protein